MKKEKEDAIKKFANIFSMTAGNRSIYKHLDFLFKDDYNGSTKRDQIIYLLKKYYPDNKKLMYILREIFAVHNVSFVKRNIDKINECLINFNLYVDENLKLNVIDSVIMCLNEAEFIVNSQLDNIPKNLPQMPEDILEKGKNMAYAYLLLYILENYLRLFISQANKNKKLEYSAGQKKKIENRKNQEEKNTYHAVRGTNDLFYLDLSDLCSIIVNNWNSFIKYFPNQNFIKTRLEELVITRNHVAHNSIISDNDFRRLITYFEDILNQIAFYFH
ncbi:MAG: hypothetical protein K9W45_11230 [Candidatus Heimdallarchaeum aukensis]|uniref:Swt1-like HEPN domain-containing protein n=1 Tax=Candidatus Heimdallarchaeum aukensis TaxID=2876573 RepID=A0A9Y1BKH8_9ARCH|nr:MAG: hypothetical protein K9W45_11230 [Candidatus Heimdallarchaeum aukensis]